MFITATFSEMTCGFDVAVRPSTSNRFDVIVTSGLGWTCNRLRLRSGWFRPEIQSFDDL